MHAKPTSESHAKRHRPRRLTVFVAAFVAGAAAAIGVNRALDVHLAQRKPQVESEPIFVALRSLPQGSPVTVWDVALRDWPKAMLPTAAMRAHDSFEGCLLRHPLREGQPLLRVQLVTDGLRQATADGGPVEAFTPPTAVTPAAPPVEADLWTPAPAAGAATAAVTPPKTAAVPDVPVASPATAPLVATAEAAEPAADAGPAVAEQAVPLPDADAAASTDTGGNTAGEDATEDSVATRTEASEAATVEPEAVAMEGEPTLADPLPGEPTPADTPPPVDDTLESVVTARSVTTPTADVPPPVEPIVPEPSVEAAAGVPNDARKPRDGIVRYLVVPERIALQADAGFARPQPSPTTAAPATEKPTPMMLENLPAVREQAPSREQQATRGRSPQSSQRSVQQASPRTARPQPQPVPRQPKQRRQADAPANRQAATESPRERGGWFPNITAGIDALTGRGRASTRDSGYDEAVATDDPTYRQR